MYSEFFKYTKGSKSTINFQLTEKNLFNSFESLFVVELDKIQGLMHAV